MFLIFISEDQALAASLLPYMDSLLQDQCLHGLELFSYAPYSISALSSLSKDDHYYFLLDIRSLIDPVKIVRHLFAQFPYSQTGILSDDDASYLKLCNQLLHLKGYLNISAPSWKEELKLLFSSLSEELPKTREALVISIKSQEIIVPYSSIYYIETIKGTHYCQLKSPSQDPIFRGNISHLITVLDERFSIVRSSTIANLSLVSKINRREKLLFFNSNIFCNYAERYYKLIHKKLK